MKATFKYLLGGLLILASTGLLVSCGDDDDDVKPNSTTDNSGGGTGTSGGGQKTYTYNDLKGVWVSEEQYWLCNSWLSNYSAPYNSSTLESIASELWMDGYHFRSETQASFISFSLVDTHWDDMMVYKTFNCTDGSTYYLEERYGRYNTHSFRIDGNEVWINNYYKVYITSGGSNLEDESGVKYRRIRAY